MRLLSLIHGEIEVRGHSVHLPRQVVDDVLAAVIAAQGVRRDEILSNLRTARVARARHEVMWRLREMTNADGSPRYSTPEIGRALGRDHTTVLHGVERHAKRLGFAP